jgi:hypothetical protein
MTTKCKLCGVKIYQYDLNLHEKSKKHLKKLKEKKQIDREWIRHLDGCPDNEEHEEFLKYIEEKPNRIQKNNDKQN